MLTARVPNKLTLLLTHRCNQACEFCFDASNVLAASIENDIALETVELLLEELQRSVTDVASFNLTLSGGEPVLHPRFMEIARAISDAGFSLTVITNGQRFADPRFMDAVLKFNIWNLQFSIEGASADVHDARVGCPGAWSRLVTAITNARERGVRFITNSTMTPRYVDEMFRIVDFLAALGVPKMNIGNTLPECSGRNYHVLFEYPAVVEIAEQLTLYALTRSIGFSFITPLPGCLKAGRVISNPSVCSAGAYSIVLDTDGSLLPCSVCAIQGPKLARAVTYKSLQADLQEMVRKDVYADLPPECRDCASLAECRAACPLYWKVPGVRTPSAWNAHRTAV